MLHSNWLLLEVVNTRKEIHQNGIYNLSASFLSVANITTINTILYIPFFCFRFRTFVLSAILHRTPDASNVLKIQRNWLSSNKTECYCNEKPVFRFERAQFTKAHSSRRYFEKFIRNTKNSIRSHHVSWGQWYAAFVDCVVAIALLTIQLICNICFLNAKLHARGRTLAVVNMLFYDLLPFSLFLVCFPWFSHRTCYWIWPHLAIDMYMLFGKFYGMIQCFDDKNRA